MEQSSVGLVILATFSNQKTARRLAELASGRAVVLAQEVNALPGVETYQALFDHNVEALLAAHELPPQRRAELGESLHRRAAERYDLGAHRAAYRRLLS